MDINSVVKPEAAKPQLQHSSGKKTTNGARKAGKYNLLNQNKYAVQSAGHKSDSIQISEEGRAKAASAKSNSQETHPN